MREKNLFIDKKIITSWNALMIKAMFEISTLNKNYLKEAKESLDSLIDKLYINKVLYHQKVLEKRPTQVALLRIILFY